MAATRVVAEMAVVGVVVADTTVVLKLVVVLLEDAYLGLHRVGSRLTVLSVLREIFLGFLKAAFGLGKLLLCKLLRLLTHP